MFLLASCVEGLDWYILHNFFAMTGYGLPLYSADHGCAVDFKALHLPTKASKNCFCMFACFLLISVMKCDYIMHEIKKNNPNNS